MATATRRTKYQLRDINRRPAGAASAAKNSPALGMVLECSSSCCQRADTFIQFCVQSRNRFQQAEVPRSVKIDSELGCISTPAFSRQTVVKQLLPDLRSMPSIRFLGSEMKRSCWSSIPAQPRARSGECGQLNSIKDRQEHGNDWCHRSRVNRIRDCFRLV